MFDKKNIDRILMVQIGFLFVISIIFIKLIWVSVIQADYYRERAQDQYEKSIVLQPKRGLIFDRNGRILAFNQRVKSIHVLNYQVECKELIDSVFCEVFERERGYYLERMGDRFGFVLLERRADIEKANRIMEHNLRGVHCVDNYRRIYPYNQVGAQVIGFTNIDNIGISGIENYYDATLSGEAGKAIMFSDALGRRNPILAYGGESPKDGSDIHLTIDIELQTIVEAELEKGVLAHNAAGGIAVFLQPQTGEVLAMASYPGFNPNNIAPGTEAAQKNRTVTDVFEPGSIFKIVTYACAIEDPDMCPTDTIDCENGVYRTRHKVTTDAHPEGLITMKQVFVKSSNVGTVKMMEHLDKNLVFSKARTFGFGTSTGIDFVGEVGGRLPHPSTWSAVTPYTFPIGYEVSVTALQVAAAYGAIANGGILMRPFLAKRIVSKGTEKDFQPVRVRRVFDEEVERHLLEAMVEVVDSGTARRARIDGVKMAGKTGTSIKLNPDGRGYWAGRYISTFSAFAPASNAQIVGVVSIDDPRAGVYYGGAVAGPVFKSILEKASNSGIIDLWEADFAKGRDSLTEIVVPDLYRMRRSQAERVLEARGLKANFYGNGLTIFSQNPKPNEVVRPGVVVQIGLSRSAVDLEEGELRIPDVKGFTMREAVNKLVDSGVSFRIIGSGKVREIDPPPGKRVNPGDICLVVCE